MIRVRKNILPAVFLTIIFFSEISAQSSQILFEGANSDYLEGNYEQAIEKYIQILNNDVQSGEVYFNLGSAYYKLNQYGRAILYYEKAEKFLSGDEALEKNLKLVRLRIIDKIEPIPQLFIKVWWNDVLNLLGLNMYAWITLIFFMVLTFLIAVNILRIRKMNKIIWIVASIFLLVLILFINKAYIFETIQFGIILSDKVSIVSEPNISGTEMFILHEGTKVQKLRKLGDWLEIKIADGKTGWLKSETLESI